jgi:hypothetical protein
MRRSIVVLVGLSLVALGAAVGGGIVYLFMPRGAATPSSTPRLLEATVLLPTQGNPDKPFSEKEWNDAVGDLARQFGGATLGPLQEGCWIDAHGKLLREPVRPVTVAFRADRETEFRNQLRQLGKRLGQQTLYIRHESPRIEFLDADP